MKNLNSTKLILFVALAAFGGSQSVQALTVGDYLEKTSTFTDDINGYVATGVYRFEVIQKDHPDQNNLENHVLKVSFQVLADTFPPNDDEDPKNNAFETVKYCRNYPEIPQIAGMYICQSSAQDSLYTTAPDGSDVISPFATEAQIASIRQNILVPEGRTDATPYYVHIGAFTFANPSNPLSTPGYYFFFDVFGQLPANQTQDVIVPFTSDSIDDQNSGGTFYGGVTETNTGINYRYQ